jgi:solute carrier family 25 carnitine/acylcarnitine transporter 20/29
MGAPLVGTAPIFALSFFGFDWGKQLVKDISGTGSKDLNALQLAAAGGFSGILTTTIMAPGERIKCILQVRINWPLYTWGQTLFEIVNVTISQKKFNARS